ncbi:glycosyltransferase family 4 protein [Leptolyngbya sp. O-77]|uniref:glycosyltransferase family 4 protein n=1 Tax=Leptolyngbya sp. O-77 TaxID=1080068 RepID=UPI00074D3594|nr:glycosyltransferase family 4 protein [Leptolyngbya sp. O-77]BAU41759.1 Lipopolysaccharide core biosynthesis protein RfaG [Leptolyngbya sp. O-77]
MTLLASEVAPDLVQHPGISLGVAIPVNGLPTELLRNLMFSWQSRRWLAKHAVEFDLVKLNGAITDFPADINAVHFVHHDWLRFAKRSLRESPANHTSGLRGLYQRLYTALNAHWEKRAFRRSGLLIAVSQQVKQSLLSIGVPEEKIRLILNGVDTVEFSPGKVSRDLWNLPAEVPLGLFAGDIKTPRKNLDTVLHALTQVSALHLAVAGDTEGSPYPKLAEGLGVGDRVHFLGYRRDLKDLMKAVDLFIFPSRYEACSLVLLEALATGLPVVTAATTGGAEIVTPDCGVVLPDPNDVDQLAQTLNALIADPTRRSHMGLAARRRAEAHTWDGMAQQYLDLFDAMCCPVAADHPQTADHETHRHHSHLLPR